jgi:hypothetical protein
MGVSVRVGDVGRYRQCSRSGFATLGGCGFEVVAWKGDECNGGTLQGQSKRGGAADSGAGTGDQGDAIGEAEHRHSLLEIRLQVIPARATQR